MAWIARLPDELLRAVVHRAAGGSCAPGRLPAVSPAFAAAFQDAQMPGRATRALLDLAVRDNGPSLYNNIHAVKWLLDHGADVHVDNDRVMRRSARDGRLEFVRTLLAYDTNANIQHTTALAHSAGMGHLDSVRALLDHGTDPDGSDGWALRLGAEKGQVGAVRMLLDRGADIHVVGGSALNYSAYFGHVEGVR